ncbi:hypothetical protein ACIQRS_11935 [Streptomyces termitum]|uniref:Uncharacterized protein n=1 Tax=Streptomyces termitum TaxID=67368 RepID=A0A918W5D7_9ACTN|nr:hypothetical protein [Streptomyces termitum]GHA70478.1 hypothetical protein GCM10010305_11070 [Streptomyces termitum]
MRSCPIALSAAGAALALVLAPTAGTAFAHDGVQVTITPSTAAPDTDVDVRAQGCSGTTGAARSQAFVREAALTGRDGDYPLYGGATLRSDIEDGTYKVSVSCDGHDHNDIGTVTVRRHHQRPTHRPVPIAPVRAGGGGTAAFAAPAAPGVAQTAGEGGLGTPYTLLGLGMAAVAAVAVARRSSRRRGEADPGAGTD